MANYVSFICLCLALAPLSAQSTIELTKASVISQGNDLFARNCATGYCHGAEGRAARGPDLRNRDWDPRKLYSSIRDGVPGTTMPPWNNILPDEEIWAVTGYIISLFSELECRNWCGRTNYQVNIVEC